MGRQDSQIGYLGDVWGPCRETSLRRCVDKYLPAGNIMLCIPWITYYLKVLSDKEVKNFVVKDFGECFKSTEEGLYSKLERKKTLEKLMNRFMVF